MPEMLDPFDLLIYLQWRGLRPKSMYWEYRTESIGGFRLTIRSPDGTARYAHITYVPGTFVLTLDPHVEGSDGLLTYNIEKLDYWLTWYKFLPEMAAAKGWLFVSGDEEKEYGI